MYPFLRSTQPILRKISPEKLKSNLAASVLTQKVSIIKRKTDWIKMKSSHQSSSYQEGSDSSTYWNVANSSHSHSSVTQESVVRKQVSFLNNPRDRLQLAPYLACTKQQPPTKSLKRVHLAQQQLVKKPPIAILPNTKGTLRPTKPSAPTQDRVERNLLRNKPTNPTPAVPPASQTKPSNLQTSNSRPTNKYVAKDERGKGRKVVGTDTGKLILLEVVETDVEPPEGDSDGKKGRKIHIERKPVEIRPRLPRLSKSLGTPSIPSSRQELRESDDGVMGVEIDEGNIHSKRNKERRISGVSDGDWSGLQSSEYQIKAEGPAHRGLGNPMMLLHYMS